MAGIKVFRCPSCGASVSTDGEEAQVTCQFCGTTVIVPEELRTKRPQQPPPRTYTPQVVVTTGRVEGQRSPTRRARSRLAGIVAVFAALCVTGIAVMPLLAGAGSFAIGVAPVATLLGSAATIPVVAASTDTPAPTATPGFATLAVTFGGEGTGAGKFDDPRAIGVDGQGNVYVGEYSLGRVQKFDAEGNFVTSWISESANEGAPLRALAADRAGSVYVVRGGDIYKHDGSSGKLVTVFQDDRSFDDVVVLPNGNLVACACFGGDALVFLDANGQTLERLEKIVSRITGDAVSNLHLAVDGAGNIFVLSQKHDAVFKYDPVGNYMDRFGSEGDAPGQFTSTGDIAVDSQSRVYISDFPGVHVFTADGMYIDVFDGPEGFLNGLAFNDQDQLYAASNANVVYRFDVEDR